jgi:hypothetical protein
MNAKSPNENALKMFMSTTAYFTSSKLLYFAKKGNSAITISIIQVKQITLNKAFHLKAPRSLMIPKGITIDTFKIIIAKALSKSPPSRLKLERILGISDPAMILRATMSPQPFKIIEASNKTPHLFPSISLATAG